MRVRVFAFERIIVIVMWRIKTHTHMHPLIGDFDTLFPGAISKSTVNPEYFHFFSIFARTNMIKKYRTTEQPEQSSFNPIDYVIDSMRYFHQNSCKSHTLIRTMTELLHLKKIVQNSILFL